MAGDGSGAEHERFATNTMCNTTHVYLVPSVRPDFWKKVRVCVCKGLPATMKHVYQTPLGFRAVSTEEADKLKLQL